ncbi:hypothetical protein ACTMU2_16690 [Cupriavidus basilensis]
MPAARLVVDILNARIIDHPIQGAHSTVPGRYLRTPQAILHIAIIFNFMLPPLFFLVGSPRKSSIHPLLHLPVLSLTTLLFLSAIPLIRIGSVFTTGQTSTPNFNSETGGKDASRADEKPGGIVFPQNWGEAGYVSAASTVRWRSLRASVDTWRDS